MRPRRCAPCHRLSSETGSPYPTLYPYSSGARGARARAGGDRGRGRLVLVPVSAARQVYPTLPYPLRLRGEGARRRAGGERGRGRLVLVQRNWLTLPYPMPLRLRSERPRARAGGERGGGRLVLVPVQAAGRHPGPLHARAARHPAHRLPAQGAGQARRGRRLAAYAPRCHGMSDYAGGQPRKAAERACTHVRPRRVWPNVCHARRTSCVHRVADRLRGRPLQVARLLMPAPCGPPPGDAARPPAGALRSPWRSTWRRRGWTSCSSPSGARACTMISTLGVGSQ